MKEPVAVTTSGGMLRRVATWLAAMAAFCASPGHAVEPLEHAPAAGSAWLRFTAVRKASIAGWRLAQRDVAVAALLVQAAEAWVALLERRERLQRVGDPAEVAQRDGHEQPGIALLRARRQQRLGRGERSANSPPAAGRGAAQLGARRGRRPVRMIRLHPSGYKKEGGPKGSALILLQPARRRPVAVTACAQNL